MQFAHAPYQRLSCIHLFLEVIFRVLKARMAALEIAEESQAFRFKIAFSIGEGSKELIRTFNIYIYIYIYV